MPQGDYVMDRPRCKRRTFYFGTRKHWSRWLLASVFTIILIVCCYKLISYGLDYHNAQQASADLREIYHSEKETPAVVTATPAPSAPPTEAPTALLTAAPTATPPTQLEPVRYPGNYYANVRSHFQKIRRQNGDIIGWLTIDDLIDEAVVQRDNEYYLNRDYRGYHNVNGAIFLDETCDLDTRPYTLLLYGHNMKTGAMFGSLRNYEDLTFYRNNPFITFNTAYEDGRYVIFAVATVSTTPDSWRYVDFTRLSSPVIADRTNAINALLSHSIYRTQVDVATNDQLLLLVTCVDGDDERRIVAARRIREDENEEVLQKRIRRITKK